MTVPVDSFSNEDVLRKITETGGGLPLWNGSGWPRRPQLSDVQISGFETDAWTKKTGAAASSFTFDSDRVEGLKSMKMAVDNRPCCLAGELMQSFVVLFVRVINERI